MIRKCLIAILCVAIFFTAQPSSAQLNNLSLVNFTPNLVIPYVLNPCPDGDCGDSSGARETKSRPQKSSAKRPVIDQTKLTYKPALADRRANLARFADKMGEADPATAADMKRSFAANDIIQSMGAGLAPYGLRIDNVSDAFAVWWINAWQASRGRSDDVDRATLQAVKQQVAQAMLVTPAITNAENAAKQEFSEILLIQASIIDSSVRQSANAPTALNQLKQAMLQAGRNMGLDFSSMTLTADGFRATKKTGAIGGVPKSEVAGSDEDQLAQSPKNPSESTDIAQIPSASPAPLNYALIAAAGGAGIAGVFMLGKAMGRKG
jgi:hypothetical protein